MPGRKRIIDWTLALRPLLRKYKGRKHPLQYKNNYQLLVVVLLSARSTDVHINEIAPALFRKYPGFSELAKAKPPQLKKLIGTVTNWNHKAKWLIEIAKRLARSNFPLDMESLVQLPGIGRKSANVIKKEAGADAEGIIVDLHVARVAQRLGIAKNSNANKIEEELMKILPNKVWSETGMALSFLGREICTAKKPQHEKCILKNVCKFYLLDQNSSKA